MSAVFASKVAANFVVFATCAAMFDVWVTISHVLVVAASFAATDLVGYLFDGDSK